MNLKKKLSFIGCFSIILSIYCLGCSLPTEAFIESTEIGTYVSQVAVIQDQHLWVKTYEAKIEFAFVKVDASGKVTDPKSEEKDTVTNIGGVSPNYSFYNGNISGTLAFTDEGVTVNLSRNISPSLVLKNILCEKKKQ